MIFENFWGRGKAAEKEKNAKDFLHFPENAKDSLQNGFA
jgi:hypothetical protein